MIQVKRIRNRPSCSSLGHLWRAFVNFFLCLRVMSASQSPELSDIHPTTVAETLSVSTDPPAIGSVSQALSVTVSDRGEQLQMRINFFCKQHFLPRESVAR